MDHATYNIPRYIDCPDDVYFIESDNVIDENYKPHKDAYIANVYQYFSPKAEYKDTWVITVDNLKEFIINNGGCTVEYFDSGWGNITIHNYDYSKTSSNVIDILS